MSTKLDSGREPNGHGAGSSPALGTVEERTLDIDGGPAPAELLLEAAAPLVKGGRREPRVQRRGRVRPEIEIDGAKTRMMAEQLTVIDSQTRLGQFTGRNQKVPLSDPSQFA